MVCNKNKKESLDGKMKKIKRREEEVKKIKEYLTILVCWIQLRTCNLAPWLSLRPLAPNSKFGLEASINFILYALTLQSQDNFNITNLTFRT